MNRFALALIPAALCAAAFAVPAEASSGDITVAGFLGRVDALKAKGVMAMFSGGEVRKLVEDGRAAGAEYRRELLAERAAGRPSSCPPEKAAVKSDHLISFLRSYSPSDNGRTPMRKAIRDYFALTWPCR